MPSIDYPGAAVLQREEDLKHYILKDLEKNLKKGKLNIITYSLCKSFKRTLNFFTLNF